MVVCVSSHYILYCCIIAVLCNKPSAEDIVEKYCPNLNIDTPIISINPPSGWVPPKSRKMCPQDNKEKKLSSPPKILGGGIEIMPTRTGYLMNKENFVISHLYFVLMIHQAFLSHPNEIQNPLKL